MSRYFTTSVDWHIYLILLLLLSVVGILPLPYMFIRSLFTCRIPSVYLLSHNGLYYSYYSPWQVPERKYLAVRLYAMCSALCILFLPIFYSHISQLYVFTVKHYVYSQYVSSYSSNSGGLILLSIIRMTLFISSYDPNYLASYSTHLLLLLANNGDARRICSIYLRLRPQEVRGYHLPPQRPTDPPERIQRGDFLVKAR